MATTEPCPKCGEQISTALLARPYHDCCKPTEAQDAERMAADQVCPWTKDEDGVWTASCHAKNQEGPSFCFDDGGPEENRFFFCPYCGKRLVVLVQ